MPTLQTPRHAKRRQIAIALFVFIALLLPALPARALLGVTATDPGHPYVGAAWSLSSDCDGDGQQEVGECDVPDEVLGSAILVAPNVALTDAQEFRNGRRVAVSFASPVDDFTDYGNTVHRGFVFKHPDFGGTQAFPGSYSHENNHDLAVIVLDEPVVGIAPVRLADIGALDAVKGTSAGKKPLTAVGYGSTTNTYKESTYDFARHTAAWELSGLKPFYAHAKAADQHGPCDGDQGGPILAGNTEAVAALMVNWDGICNAKGVGLGYRVDTAEAHDFLCFVGGADLDAAQIPNPNAPVVAGAFVDYPAVSAASAAVLADYCGSGPAAKTVPASGDDGGQQSGDRPHLGKSAHKRGGKGKHGR